MVMSGRNELIDLRAILLTFQSDSTAHLKKILSEVKLTLSTESIAVQCLLNELFLCASSSPINFVEFNVLKKDLISQIDAIMGQPVTEVYFDETGVHLI